VAARRRSRPSLSPDAPQYAHAWADHLKHSIEGQVCATSDVFCLTMPDPHTLDDLRSARSDGAVATSVRHGLGIEELRLLIAREQSLSRHVPQAIEVLEGNLLAEGDYYPGDLLHAVLDVDVTYWRAHRDQWERVDELVETFAFAQGRLTAPLQVFRARRL
jgi:hypothetical protein